MTSIKLQTYFECERIHKQNMSFLFESENLVITPVPKNNVGDFTQATMFLTVTV